ncbi:hypothetical protein VPH35_137578 [Triticum aestivum]
MGLSPPNRIQQPGKPIGVTEKKYMCPHTEHGLSPPLPLAHEPAAAAAATHVGRFSGDLRRRAARPLAPHGPRLPPLRPESPLPSSTARSQAHPPWLGFRVGLRRHVSGCPKFVPRSFLVSLYLTNHV